MALLDNGKYSCVCGSSDGRRKFVDGLSRCFSCNTTFKGDGSPLGTPVKGVTTALTPAMIKADMLSRGFEDRLIPKNITEFFGVKVGYNENGEIDTHYYPYDGGKSYKARTLPKKFEWIKEKNEKASDSLFGIELFNGGGRRVIITEGEIDAMSVAEASMKTYKKIYPVVAMSSAVMTKSLIKHREWLRSFNEIVLCLDNDEAGEVAKMEAIRILGVDKVKIAKLPLKDPNAILTELGVSELQKCIYDAARHIPSGIISKEDIWERMSTTVDLPATPYPNCLKGLNDALNGMRPHEIVLLVSGTGCGKSTVVREIELHLQETTTAMIGIIHLEEPPEKCAPKLVSMKMNVNPANRKLTLEEMKETFDNLFAGDRLILLDHQGSMKDSSIMDKLEYMCLMGCKFVFIDHITILVSEGVENEKGNEAQDKIMSDLLKLVNKYEVCIILVSHLRKTSNMQKSFESGQMPVLDDIKGCLARNTGVLLYNGTAKYAQDVIIGDELMGDDGRPRKVLRLARGCQQMYKVIMKTSGDSFICNEDHLLTLSYNDKVFDISVKDFLSKGDSFRYRCKQHYSKGYELSKRDLLIPPYSLGAWLGDGSKSAFRIMDASELGIVDRVAMEINATLLPPNDKNREYFNFVTEKRGEMLFKLKALDVYENKHIPSDYKYSSIEDRLELLAGLIDTDGTYSTRDKSFCFYQKDAVLANDVKDIARSVGLYSSIRSQVISGGYSSKGGIIFQVLISGNIEIVPTQKPNNTDRVTDALKRGINIEAMDIQDYYGFVLDGNGRFLLDNHIVTHNSGAIKQIAMDIIAFARDTTADDELVRNTTEISILKARETGRTGRVTSTIFDSETGRLNNPMFYRKNDIVTLDVDKDTGEILAIQTRGDLPEAPNAPE